MFGTMVNEDDKIKNIVVLNEGEGDKNNNEKLVTTDFKDALGNSEIKEGDNSVTDRDIVNPNTDVTIADLKNQLDTETSIDKKHEQLIQELGTKLGIGEFHSLDRLTESPQFREIAHELLDTEGGSEIEKGNKRGIDKFLFDNLNKLFDTKTALYNYFMNDPKTYPKVMGDETLKPIDEHYFDFDDHKDTDKLFALRKQFPNISMDHLLPLNIQYVVLLAVQRYTELKDTKIYVERVDGFKIMSSKQHVMRSQANATDLIKEICGISDAKDREYIIQVNVLDRDGVMTLPKMTQFAKGGVMIHELAHTLAYTRMIARKMAKFLAAFALSPRWVRGMERKTDETDIARGGGYGLYRFRQEVLAGSDNTYVDYKKRTYLGPKEILYGILKHHTSYSQDILNKVIQHIINEEY